MAVKVLKDILAKERPNTEIIGLGFTGNAARELVYSAGIEILTIASYLLPDKKQKPEPENIVKDKDKYQAANDTYSLKNRTTTGLPKDAFHDFTNSHKTRLGNRIRSIEASFEERLLLKERYNNMQSAQKEYMKVQAKVLDITLPEKSRGIER